MWLFDSIVWPYRSPYQPLLRASALWNRTHVDQAATNVVKKARKLRQRARRLLRQAGTTATHAAKARKPKLSAACAGALSDAAVRLRTGL